MIADIRKNIYIYLAILIVFILFSTYIYYRRVVYNKLPEKETSQSYYQLEKDYNSYYNNNNIIQKFFFFFIKMSIIYEYKLSAVHNHV